MIRNWYNQIPHPALKTWTVYQRHAEKLNHFHTSCLKNSWSLCGKTRSRTQRTWRRLGYIALHTLLKLMKLRWIDCATRMPDERYRLKSSTKNFRWVAPKVNRRNATRTISKPHLKTQTYNQSLWNRMRINEQSGIYSSGNDRMNTMQQEFASPSEKSTRLMHHR